MANTTWTNSGEGALTEKKDNRLKFVVGGILLLAAIAFLVVNAMSGNTQLYKTVNEFYSDQNRLIGRDLRVAGFVIGESIQFNQIDATTSRLEFDIVDDLNDPDAPKLHVVAMNEPIPDLLQHEAQALVEGQAQADGIFYSNQGGLLLKCPTRYEEVEPGEYGQTN
ncbi:MAG: cytochrome c maturation protein CcmE [Chloroflexi bacterium]|nr:cytochrome c maturation protein CcmE [Chloroflexota bacterium]